MSDWASNELSAVDLDDVSLHGSDDGSDDASLHGSDDGDLLGPILGAEPPPAPDGFQPPLPSAPGATPSIEVLPPRRGRAASKTAASEPAASKTKKPGGRGLVYAGRAVVWIAIGLIVIGGIRGIVFPDKAVDVGALASQVKAELTLSDFPVQAAQGFAVRFTHAYLNFDPNDASGARNVELGQFLTALDGTATPTVEGVVAQRVLLAFPAGVPDPIEIGGVEQENTVSITIAALLSTGEWRYLAVPVYADPDTGAMAVAGGVAFTSPPIKAAVPNNEALSGISNDSSLEAILRPRLELFFPAYAASDQNLLAGTVKPGTLIVGLGGGLEFDSVTAIEVPVILPTDDATKRRATVSVLWTLGNGNRLQQQYEVSFDLINVSGTPTYFVSDVVAGAVNVRGDGPAAGESLTVPNSAVEGATPTKLPAKESPAPAAE